MVGGGRGRGAANSSTPHPKCHDYDGQMSIASHSGAVSSVSGRGRGRGVDINKPAWMTASQPTGGVACSPHSTSAHNFEGRSRIDDKPLLFGIERSQQIGGGGVGRGRHMNRPAWMAASSSAQTAFTSSDESQTDLNAKERQSSDINTRRGEVSPSQRLRDQNTAETMSGSLHSRPSSKQPSSTPHSKIYSKRTAEKSERTLDEIKEDAITSSAQHYEEKNTILEAENDEELNRLISFLGDEGPEFKSEEERESRIAAQQREKRRRRHNELLISNDPLNTDNFPKRIKLSPEKPPNLEFYQNDFIDEHGQTNKSTVVDQPRNPAGIIQSELLIQPSFSLVEDTDRRDENETNDPKDGIDSFDMFSSSISPPTSKTEKGIAAVAVIPEQQHRNHKLSGMDSGDYHDSEGYYRATIGEIISFRLPSNYDTGLQRTRDDNNNNEEFIKFKVLGIIGKGVFSTVLKCALLFDKTNINGSQEETVVVALKLIRNNETMAKAALKEVRILRLLCSNHSEKALLKQKQKKKVAVQQQGENSSSSKPSKENEEEGEKETETGNQRELNHNIVRVLDLQTDFQTYSDADGDVYRNYRTSGRFDRKQALLQYNRQHYHHPLEHRSHTALLFEYLPYNLRETLAKFGKNVGINLSAVQSYARQLFRALMHLSSHCIVHADIKPDNILVSANFSTVKLCDFGSAFFETDTDNDPTPYLVSRFYRPPEVILGLEYNRMVDVWSVAVTLAELFTGCVLFPGRTNNDMLKRFMEGGLGPFSNKMIRRHLSSFTKMGLAPHFESVPGGSYNFRRQEVDKVTGKIVVRSVSVSNSVVPPAKQLGQVLMRTARSGTDERGDILKFADLLNRCLALDPGKRMRADEVLNHDFFVKRKNKKITTEEKLEATS